MIAEILRGVKKDIKAAYKIRQPWWAVLAAAVAGFAFAGLFSAIGHFEVARPFLFAVITLALTIAVKWPLRRCLWFWITMAVLVALHVPLIALVLRMTQGFAGPTIAFAVFILPDLIIMFVILNVVAQFLKKPKLEKNHAHRTRMKV